MKQIFIIDKKEYDKIKKGLNMGGFMLSPDNQPPQYTMKEALDVINEALDVIKQKVR